MARGVRIVESDVLLSKHGDVDSESNDVHRDGSKTERTGPNWGSGLSLLVWLDWSLPLDISSRMSNPPATWEAYCSLSLGLQ